MFTEAQVILFPWNTVNILPFIDDGIFALPWGCPKSTPLVLHTNENEIMLFAAKVMRSQELILARENLCTFACPPIPPAQYIRHSNA